MLYYNSLIPTNTDLRKRVLTTVCCEDCDNLAKVENAGHIVHSKNISRQRMHNGIEVLADCYYGRWMTTLIELLKGHHEPQEERAFHEVIQYIPNNAVMIELGSYWGYYSMWFQQQIPNATNYLIEPDPENLIIGKKNFSLNNMHGQFIQAMVGMQSLPDQTFIDWNYNQHKVNQICIDDFAAEHAIEFIHILHSDIQGVEIDMLKGCQKLINEQRIGYLFISTHRGTHEKCLEFFEKTNLEVMLSITREESFSADGLIVAKLPSIEGPKKLEASKRTTRFCTLIDGVLDEDNQS